MMLRDTIQQKQHHNIPIYITRAHIKHMKHTSIRLSENHLELIKAQGKSSTEIIKQALDAYFGVETPQAEQLKVLIHEHEKGWHESGHVSLQVPEAQFLAQSEHEAGIPSHLPLADCDVHDGSEGEIPLMKKKLQFIIIDEKKYRVVRKKDSANSSSTIPEMT